MPLLKVQYPSMADVPAEYTALYSETEKGDVVLSEVEGLKTQKDIDALTEAKRKETADKAKIAAELAAFKDAGVDIETFRKNAELVESQQKQIEAMTTGEAKDVQAKIQEAVETQVRQAKKPLEDQITKLVEEGLVSTKKLADTEQKLVNTRIDGELRKAAEKTKALPSSIEDLLNLNRHLFTIDDGENVVTKDIPGVVPNLKPEVFLQDLMTTKPHFWPSSQGGGATGAGGSVPGHSGPNPFARDYWNETEQGRLLKADPAKALSLAKAAGLKKIGDRHPVVK